MYEWASLKQRNHFGDLAARHAEERRTRRLKDSGGGRHSHLATVGAANDP